MSKVSPEEIARIKERGYIYSQKTGKFNCRIVTKSGRLESDRLLKIAEIAKQYGDGQVIFTNDGMLEISDLPYESISEVDQLCKDAGIETGGTGAKVRPVINCQGDDCGYGVIDAYSLGEKIQELFYKRLHSHPLPNKFEIAISGCPSNCMNVEWYDLGIQGVKLPENKTSKCVGCADCEIVKLCPEQAAAFGQNRLTIMGDKCSGCGQCIGKCPNGTLAEGVVAYRLYVGGRRGSHAKPGYEFKNLFTSEERLLTAIDRFISIYEERGMGRETFATTIARVGEDIAAKIVLG